LSKISVKKWLSLLSQTQRLSDAVCPSYVDETFLKLPNLAKLLDWEGALKENKYAL